MNLSLLVSEKYTSNKHCGTKYFLFFIFLTDSAQKYVVKPINIELYNKIAHVLCFVLLALIKITNRYAIILFAICTY